jgi:hypothetical protein
LCFPNVLGPAWLRFSLAFHHMALSLPDQLADKAAAFPESSHGANRVTLVLADGRNVHGVFLAWGRDIVKIGARAISRPDELDFQLADIADVISEVK